MTTAAVSKAAPAKDPLQAQILLMQMVVKVCFTNLALLRKGDDEIERAEGVRQGRVKYARLRASLVGNIKALNHFLGTA